MKEMINERQWDVVIVGGGMAGLICAGLLSGEGRKVLLVERTGELGGMFKMFSSFGTEYYFGAHHLAGLDENGLVGRVLSRVGLSVSDDFKKVTHMNMLRKGQLISVPLELSEMEEFLKERFPGEKKIGDFFQMLDEYKGYFAKGDDRGLLKMFLDNSKITYLEKLQQFFSNEELMSILTILGPGYGGTGLKGVAFNNLSLLVSYGMGSGYAKESNGRIIEKIVSKAKENGCIIATDTRCTGITVEKGRLESVQCRYKGQEMDIKSKRVVFASYPFDVLKPHLRDTRLWQKVRRFSTGASVIRVCGELTYGEGLPRGDTLSMGDYPLEDMDGHIFLQEPWDFPVCMIHMEDSREKPAIMFTFLVKSDGKPRIPKEKLMGLIEKTFPQIYERMSRSTVLYDKVYKESSNTESGAVFGWDRTPYVYLNTNSYTPAFKEIAGVYGAGHWYTDYGVYGAIRTAEKACEKILSSMKDEKGKNKS